MGFHCSIFQGPAVMLVFSSTALLLALAHATSNFVQKSPPISHLAHRIHNVF